MSEKPANIKKGIKAGNRIPPKGKATPAKTIANRHQLMANSHFETFIKNNTLLVFTLAELLLLFIVFHKFLLLNNLYLFKDVGSDTVNYAWNHFVYLSEYFRNTGFPKWSFNEGMGKNIYPLNYIGNPFTLILCLLPKDIIPYCIIFVEALKIYLGGLFFFQFLRMVKMTPFASVIGGFLFSFSGFMLIGSSMYMFSTETLYASLVLYSCEKYLRHGAWYLLPVPFFLFAAFQPFLLYLYGLLITIYSVVRIALTEGWEWKKIILSIIKMGSLAFLGVIMSCFIFLSNIDLLLHIPRSIGGEAASTQISAPIFSPTPFWEITTTLYRFFSNDLMGTGSYFMGWGWYNDSSTLYTGLLTCLLMPQVFFLMRKRKRIIYLVLTFLAIIPIFFPFFRHAFWLFTGEYYRTYSLFLSILFLFLCLKTLSALDSGMKINTRVLFITLPVLLILLYYPFYDSNSVFNYNTGTGAAKAIDGHLRLIVAFFLVVYSCLIYFFSSDSYRNRKPIAISLLGICILTELAYFSSYSVNNRPVLTSAELHQKVGYNDYTLEALAFINAHDAGIYRIGKEYGSSPSLKQNAPYNDGLIQGYMSTASYDSFNQTNYCNFLNELNVWSVEGSNYRMIGPFVTRTLISDILNEKYVLVKQPYPKVPYPYDSITTTGDVSVTRSKFFLPFGYTYQNYITLSEFRKLNNFQKDKMLFRAFVADTTVETRHALSLNNLHQLNAKDTIPGTVIDYNEFRYYAAGLRKDSLSNLVYTQNTVKGNIKLTQTKLLFFTIPYDKGWELKVDGSIAKILMTNIGFMGVVLAPGEHSIELNYEPPYLKLGCYISGFGILGYLFLLIRYRKKRF